MTIKETINDSKKRMASAVEDFRQKLTTLRTGRASISLLDNITIEYYGAQMPLNQVATINAPESALITVQPFDSSLVNTIDKAIRASDLGFNPSNDGKLVRVPIPPLTQERRKQMVKVIHDMAEEHRVAVRNIRRDANDHLKKSLKDKQISEDEEKGALADVQKMTDEHIKKIDEFSKSKEIEIMKV